MMNDINTYYSNQASGLPYFVGPSVQRGHGLGGIFGSLFRAVAPMVRSAAPIIRSAAKSTMKEAARTGADILSDVAQGASFQEAAKTRQSEAANRMLLRGAKKLNRMVTKNSKNKTNKKTGIKRKHNGGDIFD